MVCHCDLEQRCGTHQFFGDQRVRVAGQRIARRVIVHEQDPLCQALDGTFDDQFVIDHGSRYAALTDADPVENFVRCVQVKDPKLLMRQDRQFGLEKFYHIPVAHNLVTHAVFRGTAPAPDFECCTDQRSPGDSELRHRTKFAGPSSAMRIKL